MKVSQSGINWIKKQPLRLENIKWWLESEKYGCCPMTRDTYRGSCEYFCKKIWPRLKINCPCNAYGKEEVIKIAKQIVGEE